MQTTLWRFAGFEIDATAGTLRREGEPVKIGRQAFRALALLVSRRGELVSREELQKEIWGDRVHVDFEHGLNVCIRQVRLALGDEVDGSPIIVTCPREGYRLGVPVRPVTPHRWLDRLAWRDVAVWLQGARRRLVVGALAGGVAATAAVAWWAPVLWGRTAAPVSAGHAAGASDVETPALNYPTRNSEAHAWYWRGRGFYDRTTGRRPASALPYFETAAALDPGFALAHASLTLSYLDRAATGVRRAESLVKAREAARRAVTLAPRLAEAHVALAEVSYRADDDKPTSARHFLRALELDGRNAYVRQRYATFLHAQRQFDAALEQLQVARQLDPLSIMANWQIANELYYTGRYEEAMRQAARTLEIDPSHAWSIRTIGQCFEALGRDDEASAAYLKAGQVALGHLGRLYARTGRETEARDLLDALMRQPVDETGHNGVAIAFILTGLGEHAKATEWLDRLRQAGVRLPFSLSVEPQWSAVRASGSFGFDRADTWLR